MSKKRESDLMLKKAQIVMDQWYGIFREIIQIFADNADDPICPMPPHFRRLADRMQSAPKIEAKFVEGFMVLLANGLMVRGYIPTIDIKLRDYGKRQGEKGWEKIIKRSK